MARPWRVVLLLGVLAVVASLPRFGERENPDAAISDSDYYLDMARVFAGERAAFDPTWSAAGHPGAHHYARPLLPFAAAWTARLLPGLGLPRAFSVVNVLAAWATAVALLALLARAAPNLRHPWLPSALFLTGFPQVNWGYHLLTDTVGYATALGAATLAWVLIDRRGRPSEAPEAHPWLGLTALFFVQALAFLARETAWMVPAMLSMVLLRSAPSRRGFVALLLGIVVLAALPHAWYLDRFGAGRIHVPLDPARWIEPAYLLDFALKSAVAFNVLWIAAYVGRRVGARREGALPEPLGAWALGAAAYMAAGYAHNSLVGIGYPLRLSWALFPVVLYLAVRGFEAVVPRTRMRAAVTCLLLLHALVAVVGTRLDTGRSGVTAPALIEGITPPR